MRVVFIRPKPSPFTIGLQHLMVVEPLELENMASLIQHEHETMVIDMILEKRSIEKILYEINPHVFCVTGYITHIPVMIEYCRLAKKLLPGIITIVGGVHIEKFPEDIDDPSINYRVVRNATRTFPKLIEYLNKPDVFPSGVLRTGEIVDEATLPEYDFFVPFPDRSLTKKYRKEYFYVFHDKVALIKTSFGCPYTCKFCFCREITGRRYYERPLPEVMKELETIEEMEVYIIDDDFLLNYQRVNAFIDQLKERKINKRFLVYGRADFIADYPEIMKSFKECGLRTVIVGLESFDEMELSDFNKKTSENINRKAMSVLNRYGIDCYAAIIISPSWTKNDFIKAERIMKELKIKFVNLQPLTPLKGINLDIDESRIILSRDDYAKWDLAHVSIKPDHMSVSEFYLEIVRLYQKIIFSPGNILSHMKYPLAMQWKMMKGLIKVHRQYKRRIMETKEYV
jgi:radical SAM superfamily enzyme YgiQ (UPF0313 family)